MKVASIAIRLVSDKGAAALARLTGADDKGDTMLGRAARISADCPERGDIGMLTPDGYPDCGRVMVPSAVLADLVAVAAAKAVAP